MIKSFADRRTQDLYLTGTARRFPPDVAARAARKLEYVDLATSLEDLKVPPGNRLHTLNLLSLCGWRRLRRRSLRLPLKDGSR
jgi:proteic killer suppression protein